MGSEGLIKNLFSKFQKEPDSKVFAQLADELRRMGDFDEAAKIATRGLEKHPGYATGHVVLGKIFRDMCENDKAKKQFQKVIKIDPQNLLALKLLGDLFLQDGHKNRARGFYSRVLDINPTNEVVREILEELSSVILENQGTEPEIEHLDEIPTDKRSSSIEQESGKEDSNELNTRTMADIYVKQGLYEKALKIYRKIIRKNPDNQEVKALIEELEKIMGEEHNPQAVEGDDIENQVGEELDMVFNDHEIIPESVHDESHDQESEHFRDYIHELIKNES